MNFKLTKSKVTISLTIGLAIGFILGFSYEFQQIFGGTFIVGEFLLYWLIITSIVTLSIFIIWSLFQKRDKKSIKKK